MNDQLIENTISEVEGSMGVKSPKQRWSDLKQRIVKEIDAIDNDTPWSELEPEWWLEMEGVQKLCR